MVLEIYGGDAARFNRDGSEECYCCEGLTITIKDKGGDIETSMAILKTYKPDFIKVNEAFHLSTKPLCKQRYTIL